MTETDPKIPILYHRISLASQQAQEEHDAFQEIIERRFAATMIAALTAAEHMVFALWIIGNLTIAFMGAVRFRDLRKRRRIRRKNFMHLINLPSQEDLDLIKAHLRQKDDFFNWLHDRGYNSYSFPEQTVRLWESLQLGLLIRLNSASYPSQASVTPSETIGL